MGLRSFLGNTVAKVGSRLGLPEFGISERVSGAPAPSAQETQLKNPGSFDPYQMGLNAGRLGTIDPALVNDPDYQRGYNEASMGATTTSTSANMFEDHAAGGGSGGSDGSTYTPNIVYFGNPPQAYDLNNQDQALSFFNAKKVALETERDSYVEEQLRTGAEEYSSVLADIDAEISENDNEALTYIRNYQTKVKGVDQAQGAEQAGIVSNYTRLSPNAFQSHEVASADRSRGEYLGQRADLAVEADQNVGADYYNTFEQGQADPNALGGVFGARRGRLNDQRGALDTQYTNYQGQVVNDANSYVQDNMNSTAAELPGLVGNGGLNFNFDSGAPVQLATADLSKYNSFVPGQNLSGVKPTLEGGYARPISTNAFKPTENALDRFLGRTIQTQKDKDHVRSYLEKGY